jgi:glycosyltransferase involved in cell wall biosynthesis
MLRVGIYDYYLDSFGGGEKDVCAMAEALAGRYKVDILSFKAVRNEELERRLNVDLSRVEVKTVLPFTGYGCFSRALRFVSSRLFWRRISSPYDLFINLVNYAPGPCHARRGVLRIQFPFDIPRSHGGIRSYGHYLAHSGYTRNWARKRWGVDAQVLYPPVEGFAPGKKEDVILSVGRFFEGGHNKKHLTMVSAFKKLCDAGLKGWEYHIIGGTLPGRENEAYLGRVRESAKGYPVFIHADAPFSLLSEYYAKSRLFLHATGFGEDGELHPERFEHFGRTTVEAMSAGCVPVVFAGGGQREVVTHGTGGYLWRTEEELVRYCREAVDDRAAWERLSETARGQALRFGMGRYREEVIEMAGRATAGL